MYYRPSIIYKCLLPLKGFDGTSFSTFSKHQEHHCISREGKMLNRDQSLTLKYVLWGPQGWASIMR